MTKITADQNAASENQKYVFGTAEVRGNILFIRKSLLKIDGGELWTPVSISYWKDNEKQWKIDNGLFQTLDHVDFHVIDKEEEFFSMLEQHYQSANNGNNHNRFNLT